jgi:hypothetical protein
MKLLWQQQIPFLITKLFSCFQVRMTRVANKPNGRQIICNKEFLIPNSDIRRNALQPGIRGGIGTVVRGNNNDNLFGARVLAIAGLGAAPESLSTNPKTYLFFGKNIKLELEVKKRQSALPNWSLAAKITINIRGRKRFG